MARQSKSDFAARKAQNKGVRHGTTKMGKGGKVMRRWNANTARWEVASKPATAAPKRKVAGRGPSLGARARASKAATRYTSASVMQSPKTSWGSAWTSTGGAGSANRAMRRPGTPRPSLFGLKRPKGPRTAKQIVSLRTGRS